MKAWTAYSWAGEEKARLLSPERGRGSQVESREAPSGHKRRRKWQGETKMAGHGSHGWDMAGKWLGSRPSQQQRISSELTEDDPPILEASEPFNAAI